MKKKWFHTLLALTLMLGLAAGMAVPAAAAAVPSAADSGTATKESLPKEALELAEIDLASLRAVNADVVGWIAIPGTKLSYPLVQGTDNEYYLKRNWKKEYNEAGAVFIESAVSRDLTDAHSIIYAHRMKNDSMFGSIKYYNDLDYWKAHPSVYVVLDDVIYRYDIFSAYYARVRSVVYRLDMEESHLEESFIKYCKEHSEIDTGLTPKADSRFLTLSTCTGFTYASRWVVNAALAQEYKLSGEDAPAGLLEVPEGAVPMAGMPGDLIEVPEEAVPMANMPESGNNSYVLGILVLTLGVGLVWLILRRKKPGEFPLADKHADL